LASGTGPNPALAQLANTTGQNIANQAALMAGQRGAGSNVGLLARQIGQQGAGVQQQAVGQAAALQAQQQLNAMNTLQNQQALMGSLAGSQVGQQLQGLQGYNQAAQAQQAQLLAALDAYNRNKVAMQSNINATNAGLQSQVAGAQAGLMGGVLGGVGSALGLAEGGEVPDVGPKSFVGKFFQGYQESINPAAEAPNAFMPMAQGQNQALVTGLAKLGSGLGNLFQSSAAPQGVASDAISLNVGSKGGKVPGKAEVSGNSTKNDNVPALLSPGEVVIPRSVMNSKDPVKNAAKFVADVLAKKGKA